MKPSETDMQQDLVQEAIRNQIEAPVIGAAPAIGTLAVDTPAIGSSSSATEIGAVVVSVYSQLEEHGKILHNHGKMLERISMSTVGDSTLPLGDTPLLGQYQFSTPKKNTKRNREGGNENEDEIRKKAEPRTLQRDLQQKNQMIEEKKKGKGKWQKKSNANKKNKKAGEAYQVARREGLEVVKYLMVDDDVKVNLEAISFKYSGGLLTKGDEKDNDDNINVEENLKSEEEQPHVAEEKDLEPPTVVVYYDGKKDSKEEVEHNKEEVVEGKYDDDRNSQNKPDPEQLVLVESEVDITLKKGHVLTEDEINERAFKITYRMNQLHAHLGELLPGVLLESFIQRHISQDEKN
ncbi:hypothetical protein GIB67_029504 [Kingdonia uniflora]|uniref:Uncharacterized protein n=1 Tax=Kingdonia uniflora TaxID=39325 RepID=A0A7J7NY12_9MAGN|nr:hypothetical protein GIB67_029504 [Kingdonia uniflora]